MSSSLKQKLEEAHSASLINKLAKDKHQRLHKQIEHIQQLLSRCSTMKSERENQFKKKFEFYEQTIKLLEEEIGKKDTLIQKLTQSQL